MTHIVTGNCEDCKFTDCVETCPVDCFYMDDRMLYIHPDECIDCGACVPACPVEAIFPGDSVPEDQTQWTDINAEKSTGGECENITAKQDPLPSAEEKKTNLGY